ncbi:long-chain-fatty-acid--ligase [Lichtheimia corymbifera JMRC:FSU:9682]|uniref:Long-chain-fatty-acid--ligase n=1 Tax=Lichtheimia corymbifera JMRC:FSU:9682 TaxID=1263082 RepID=A0A068S799_9FUNG|nr:long-chain-fatty-acid--ligase [Lichtheimia corymbifera JMRC:FSU:9682]
MKNFSVEVGPNSQPNGGRIRRAIYSPEELVRIPHTDVHTLYDVLQYSVKRFGEKRAFGFRKVEQIIEEEKEVVKYVNGVEQKSTKTWKYFQLSGYHYLSYKSASQLAHELGSGFVHLGLSDRAKVELFAPTNAHWLMTAHALFTQGNTIVTAYDTLGEEGLLHSMNETGVEAIYTTGELLPTVAKVIDKCPTLKFVVFQGEASADAIEGIQKNSSSVQRIISFDDLARLGKEHMRDARPPEPEDLCCIMYTSGSTGNPKGVMLTHKNIVAAIAACNKILGHLVNERDSMMAYLPLAHILEFVVENLCIFWGVTLGYASVRTLTDTSVRNCKGDIREFRPTIMTGVPQVWESIRKGVLAKVNALSPKAQAMFHKAFATKLWLMERQLPTGFLDKTIFGKIRDQVGGRLRFALSGGAPVSIETQRFLSVTVCPILGGYGMTESCGMCGIMVPEQFGYGHVGSPVPCCEIKLVDVPDAGYRSTNSPKPQGEVWVRGPSITQGYWKREDLTRETITADGWLQTGDIAEWNENGTLAIIDRKKNLVKLSNGEYIALEKLESVYKSCLYVNNICVYADPLRPRAVALVVPVENTVRDLAKEHGLDKAEWEDICSSKDIRQAVLKAMTKQGKEANLKAAELLFDVYLCPEEWTIESGLLTAAQKIKRQDINRRYKDQLDTMNNAQAS